MIMNRKLIKVKDFIILLIIITVCGLFILISHNQKKGSYAVISVNGKKAERLSLSKDIETFTVKGADNISFTITNGEIYVSESDCPDKICLKTGHISRKGQSIICVPKRVSVTIESSGNDTDVTIG